ncbi:MAG TPA: ThaI family type II restriction endonuclease [Candidatus Paceibacterota bacterium]|nr:ThaI family type II restriction endonuclease [Candidatus Paceibacterota bacterium]
MSNKLIEIFNDEKLIAKIKSRLPHLFQIAELESSRAGKIGMEVGSLREKIITALLIYKFGKENVETEIPITESEIDANLFGTSISIKTITGTGFSGVKLVWTVDAQKADEFRKNYQPSYDLLLVQINWGGIGGFYYIPLKSQQEIFNQMGRENYIQLPKPGTNPRGAEITKKALLSLVRHKDTKIIEIPWEKTIIEFSPYKRWVDYWEED